METPIPVLTEEEFIDALSRLMGQCLASEADYDMVLRNLGITTAHVLSLRMRQDHLFPEDIDAVLDAVCAGLRELVWRIIHDYDTAAAEGDA
jgi:hypothetical protein